ncbi:MAG: glycoside hydrolase family 3 protein, partial [Chloroflexota bacterium]|nr:glycoside hydrolase family 3 protein [Chloroflexota bacterium]
MQRKLVTTLMSCALLLCVQSTTHGAAGPSPTLAPSATTSWAQATLARMTLREKVGQMFVAYAYGQNAYDVSPDVAERNRALYGVNNAAGLINRYHVGGIIYFGWASNLTSVGQVARLSNGDQYAAMHQRVPVPLLISTDEEQGIIYRVPAPFTAFPGGMAIGATRSARDARNAAYITGKELRALGINQNLAPDADVNVNPANPIIGVRSFGSYSPMVASMTAAQVQGFQSVAVAATAKHFPGHGDTDTDSHTGLPVIHHTLAQFNTIDLPPFERAISAGVDAIMSAHIVVPALDSSGRPATLSRPILTGVLRNRLGFRGVIITDSLQMAGVRQMFPDSRVPVEAIKAGADMLLMPPNLDLAIGSVVTAVQNGEISQARIDQSVLRILSLKQKLGLPSHPYVNTGAVSASVGTSPHRNAAAGIANRGITLVKNSGMLPLNSNSGKSVLVTGWGVATTATIARGISAQGLTADRYVTGSSPSSATIADAVSRAGRHSLTVVTTHNVEWDLGQRALVKALVATGRPVTVVAVEHPYDIAYFTAVRNYLV